MYQSNEITETWKLEEIKQVAEIICQYPNSFITLKTDQRIFQDYSQIFYMLTITTTR